MSFTFLSLPKLPSSHFNQVEAYTFKPYGTAFPITNFSCKDPQGISKSFHRIHRDKTHNSLKPTLRECINSDYEAVTEDHTIPFDWGIQGDLGIEDMESPWEGAIIYKRKPANLHLEYCTTLERLGLGDLSTDVSKSKASVMGLRVTKAVKDYPDGTPVQISMEVTRRGNQNLRLDGIIKTVLTLFCERCSKPAGKSVFVNFTLLLTVDPVEESEFIDMGVIYGDDKLKSYNEEEAEDDATIDVDDRMHFPPEDEEIDISKYIRDLVHLEKTYDVVCDPGCKGVCYNCGTNLNIRQCDCDNEEEEEEEVSTYRPFENLKKQIYEK